ncbi:MAG TPA: hypothetical protein VJN21_00675 [Candidatus Acidoferrales bacterium]|nr:hypothetical protein [Candidatus Acidoferrales bacterium]
MSAFNYFNYFTEIEEYFWQKRGAHLLVSPLDWAIVETWQKAGIPLPAVLRGIDRAFESYGRSRRGAAGRPLKSLAYCVDSVLEAAEESQEAAAGAGPETSRAIAAAEPFSREELARYFNTASASLRAASEKPGVSSLQDKFAETANSLSEMKSILDSPAKIDLEDLERRLTVIEEKLTAALAASADEGTMLGARRDMDAALAPYRRKMSPAQLALVERQYIQNRLFEAFGLPRLSLYYLK